MLVASGVCGLSVRSVCVSLAQRTGRSRRASVRCRCGDAPAHDQRHKAVAVALGITNVHTPTLGIDVGHAQGQAFTEPQTHAVQGEEKHALAQDVLHNQADRIDDMTMRITSWDTGKVWRRVAASSNLLIDADAQHQLAASLQLLCAGHRRR